MKEGWLRPPLFYFPASRADRALFKRVAQVLPRVVPVAREDQAAFVIDVVGECGGDGEAGEQCADEFGIGDEAFERGQQRGPLSGDGIVEQSSGVFQNCPGIAAGAGCRRGPTRPGSPPDRKARRGNRRCVRSRACRRLYLKSDPDLAKAASTAAFAAAARTVTAASCCGSLLGVKTISAPGASVPGA